MKFVETFQVLGTFRGRSGTVTCFVETPLGYSMADIVADICNGEYLCDSIDGVYRCAIGEPFEDVSNAVADEIVLRACRGEWLSDLAKRFVDYCGREIERAA